MKKAFLIVALLCLAVNATAGLKVVVKFPDDGLPPNLGWAEWEDSKLNIFPGDQLYIGFSDNVAPAAVEVGDVFYLGITEGPGVLDLSSAAALAGVSLSTVDDAQLAADLGIQNNFAMASIEADPIASMVVYNMLFECEGPGDVTFYAYDENFQVVDTQVIHQIPEPATLALLSIGCLLLRKRNV